MLVGSLDLRFTGSMEFETWVTEWQASESGSETLRYWLVVLVILYHAAVAHSPFCLARSSPPPAQERLLKIPPAF